MLDDDDSQLGSGLALSSTVDDDDPPVSCLSHGMLHCMSFGSCSEGPRTSKTVGSHAAIGADDSVDSHAAIDADSVGSQRARCADR